MESIVLFSRIIEINFSLLNERLNYRLEESDMVLIFQGYFDCVSSSIASQSRKSIFSLHPLRRSYFLCDNLSLRLRIAETSLRLE